jgi:hypothetical protein
LFVLRVRAADHLPGVRDTDLPGVRWIRDERASVPVSRGGVVGGAAGMKTQGYEYQKGEVSLKFAFAENERMERNKEDFLDLLKEAVEELGAELEDAQAQKEPS